MADIFPPEKRRAIMRAIQGKNTKPEMIVRRLVFALGYRYRLHDSNLPGKPDLVFKSRRKVIFVHGCYWHRHSCREGNSIPKTRRKFWVNKFSENISRDKRVKKELKRLKWSQMVVWECFLKRSCIEWLTGKIHSFLTD
jgi:DNA mismatch endonuclease, patch repair protein